MVPVFHIEIFLWHLLLSDVTWGQSGGTNCFLQIRAAGWTLPCGREIETKKTELNFDTFNI